MNQEDRAQTEAGISTNKTPSKRDVYAIEERLTRIHSSLINLKTDLINSRIFFFGHFSTADDSKELPEPEGWFSEVGTIIDHITQTELEIEEILKPFLDRS